MDWKKFLKFNFRKKEERAGNKTENTVVQSAGGKNLDIKSVAPKDLNAGKTIISGKEEKPRRLKLKKIDLKNINIKNVFSGCGKFWFRHYRKLLFILFIAAAVYGVYLWHKCLYRSQWSEERKKQYVLERMKKTEFKEKDFNAILEEIKNRQAEYDKKEVEAIKDIFKPIE